MMPDAALHAGLESAFGSSIRRIEVTATQERPYSSIRFCRADLADGTSREVVVKVYKPWYNSNAEAQRQLLLRDYEITVQLHRLLCGQARLRVPTPLFHCPEHLLIATERMPGTRLQDKLKQAGWFPGEAALRELEADCRACGEWLREFQRLTRRRDGATLDLAGMRKAVAYRLDWAVDAAHIPLSSGQRAAFLEYFDRLSEQITGPDLAVAGVHGDFFAGNLLVSPGQVVGLDYVMYREGSVYVDPSYFVFQLETLRYKPQFRGATVARLRNAFLTGYDPESDPERFAARPIARLHALFHEAMRLGRMLVQKDAPLLKRLNNRRIAFLAISRLSAQAQLSANA